MYKIFNQTKKKTLGYVDEPRYIYLAPNGSFVQCEQQDAQGIAYKSNPYNLFGRKTLNADFDIVLVQEVDGGELFEEQKKQIAILDADLVSNDEMIVTLYEQLANVDEVLISLYEVKEMI